MHLSPISIPVITNSPSTTRPHEAPASKLFALKSQYAAAVALHGPSIHVSLLAAALTGGEIYFTEVASDFNGRVAGQGEKWLQREEVQEFSKRCTAILPPYNS